MVLAGAKEGMRAISNRTNSIVYIALRTRPAVKKKLKVISC
jgi:hypothetical protein